MSAGAERTSAGIDLLAELTAGDPGVLGMVVVAVELADAIGSQAKVPLELGKERSHLDIEEGSVLVADVIKSV